MPSSLHEKGFTLLEVLMALTVFALIVGVCYTALGPAGEGFKQLQQMRDQIETSSWLGKQLRTDIAAVTTSSLRQPQAIAVSNDVRGNTHVDELTLLLRESGHRGLTWVHYHLDENSSELLRDSRMAWARDSVAADHIVLAKKVSSFEVEVMNPDEQWQQKLAVSTNIQANFPWPKAVRVTIRQENKQLQWLLPLYQSLQ